MAIRILPTTPRRTDDPDTFIANTDAWMNTLPGVIDDINATAGTISSAAAGGAYAIPYVLDTTATADSDPGNGKIRFNQTANQSNSTFLFLDDLNVAGSNVSGLVGQFNSSSSAVKGRLRMVKMGDTSKWLTFDVIGRTVNAGYTSVQVSSAWGTGASPFANGDTVLVYFDRTGDVGPAGTIVRRTASVTTVGTTAPDMNSVDMYVVTAQASAITLGVPTGTLTDGRQLMYRIKDNGTVQTFAYNAIYRAPVEIPFPATTVAGKWTYLGFVYNATDAKWDLISAISNM